MEHGANVQQIAGLEDQAEWYMREEDNRVKQDKSLLGTHWYILQKTNVLKGWVRTG